jgi:hypothetical protein
LIITFSALSFASCATIVTFYTYNTKIYKIETPRLDFFRLPKTQYLALLGLTFLQKLNFNQQQDKYLTYATNDANWAEGKAHCVLNKTAVEVFKTDFWIVGIEGDNCSTTCEREGRKCDDQKFQEAAKKIKEEGRVVLDNRYESYDIRMNPHIDHNDDLQPYYSQMNQGLSENECKIYLQ